MEKIFKAWAIKEVYEGQSSFFGKLFWFNRERPIIPTQLAGCKFSLFENREDARQALYELKVRSRMYPRTSVKRVQITVEEIS